MHHIINVEFISEQKKEHKTQSYLPTGPGFCSTSPEHKSKVSMTIKLNAMHRLNLFTSLYLLKTELEAECNLNDLFWLVRRTETAQYTLHKKEEKSKIKIISNVSI